MSLTHDLISSSRTGLRMSFITLLLFLLINLIELISLTEAQTPTNNTIRPIDTDAEACQEEASACKDGLLLPMWTPQPTKASPLSTWDKTLRAIVYMSVMIYMFIGVASIADRFMESIETITAKKKEITVKRPNGEVRTLKIRVWNETVSNLTLLALGSSAPEILLSVIEICGKKFEAGALGPSTIVGSASFNLFVIIAICMYCIPDGQTRRIKNLGVFFVTAGWSLFAYLWLLFIVAFSSRGEIKIWEAVLTLAFFPATVLTAYVADRKLKLYKYLSKRYVGIKKASISKYDSNTQMDYAAYKGTDHKDSHVRKFEETRADFIEIMKQMRKENPDIDPETLEIMAAEKAVERGAKSHAYYRMKATNKLTKKSKISNSTPMGTKSSVQSGGSVSNVIHTSTMKNNKTATVYFDPGHYTVMENVGSFKVTVTREGGDPGKICHVDYHTEDGTAMAGLDYIEAYGTLRFEPYEYHKAFEIEILDDDEFEEDEHFYVMLKNPRLSGGMLKNNQDSVALAQPFMATVMILDDDHPGVFHFEDDKIVIPENIGELQVKVCRSSAVRGMVKVPYHAVDGTARANDAFEVTGKEIYFENNEIEQFITVNIIDDQEYQKWDNFKLVLGHPVAVMRSGNNIVPAPESTDVKLRKMGRPRLGTPFKVNIIITESIAFRNAVDKLMDDADAAMMVGASSWKNQFIDAITVSPDEDENDDNDRDEEAGESEKPRPSCIDYTKHIFTVFWKLFSALIPPSQYLGGWPCFVISILLIGFVTAIIGDLASSFGCTVGLKDAVTAISFVALGTSVPDTFASKVAAINDRYADASIGNVTGSNAVNVFLGIGIAWTIAAIYHFAEGTEGGFTVPVGDIAMSVTVFSVLAVFAVGILLYRRWSFIGGELGGPRTPKLISSAIFVIFWLIYILISSLTSYCKIPSI